jgi:hypothetical protein
VSAAASGPPSAASAALRLTVFVTAVVLVTTRVGLVVHELVGHGGAANAVGAGVDEVRLFWFAGGWIQYSRATPWSLGDVLVVQLAGIAIELVVGLALVGWGGRRTGWTRVALVGAGLGWVIHAGAYLAIGTWHGFGDGTVLHKALGDAKAAVAIPAGVLCVVAAYLGARALAPPLAAVVPSASRAGRLLVVAAALGLAGGVNAGLSRLELVIRGDTVYGAIMKPERDRAIERELAAWLAAQRERGLPVDPEAAARAERRIARAHPSFPFAAVLGVATPPGATAGAVRRRTRADAALDPPLARPILARVTFAALAAIALVGVVDAIFPV